MYKALWCLKMLNHQSKMDMNNLTSQIIFMSIMKRMTHNPSICQGARVRCHVVILSLKVQDIVRYQSYRSNLISLNYQIIQMQKNFLNKILRRCRPVIPTQFDICKIFTKTKWRNQKKPLPSLKRTISLRKTTIKKSTSSSDNTVKKSSMRRFNGNLNVNLFVKKCTVPF